MSGDSTRPRVLIVGGGVAALEFVLALTEHLPGVADIELLTPETAFTYRPLATAELFGAAAPYRFELAKLAARLGARLHPGRLASVDATRHLVFTSAGETLAYDLLVVACGARAAEGLPGALTFRGEQDEAAFRALLGEVADGAASSLVFAIPPGTTWPLPLYELALMSAAELGHRGSAGHTLTLVTSERAPLEQFGGAASDAVATLLEDAGIAALYGRRTTRAAGGELLLTPGGRLPADRVVATARLRGPAIAGLPSDPEGFIPTDLHGLVTGLDAVYAAGDATAFPVKQGGIAVQQADAVAEAVAARLGAPIRPTPFRPLLRGILLTGGTPRFLSADPAGGTSTATVQPLWWPPGKVAGGWLARFLHAEGIPVPPPPGGPGTMQVELELSAAT